MRRHMLDMHADLEAATETIKPLARTAFLPRVLAPENLDNQRIGRAANLNHFANGLRAGSPIANPCTNGGAF